MQLSYKIIKNKYISYDNEGVDIANVNMSDYIEEIIEDDEPKNFAVDDGYNIEHIKSEMRKNLLLELEEERQALIEKALKEAQSLKQGIIEKGYKAGFEKGYQEGIHSCKVECNRMKENSISLFEDARQEVKYYFAENKDMIIRLAGDMAETITHKVIDLAKENILMLIKPIIQVFEKNENIIITCHPNNSTYLKSNIRELEISCPNTRFIILKDNNLEKNGCIIENENQIIDLQIKKQIDSIIKDIKELGD